ncbi:hypothetical protein T31B1_07493 [Salinisphaera sp. T31B1]
MTTLSTGWPRLDRLLPGGGYPLSAVTELLYRDAGIGELTLLLGTLAERLACQSGRRIALVSPTHSLNAPALATSGIDCARAPVIHCRDDAERVWCIEQMAQTQAFCAFVLWSDTLDYRAIRRLQLAAENATSPVFVYRPLRCATQRSPAALRLAISGRRAGQRLEIIKCRGPAGARLNGLCAGDHASWQRPDTEADLASLTRPRAHNDLPAAEHGRPVPPATNGARHVARAAFPPLGAR